MGINEMLLAGGVGLVIGGVFGLMKLPLPTPDKIEGVIAVIAVFVGMTLVKQFT